ncbi:MAG: hypothetical protein NC819_02300 [Candidatus Omnitrophica bacterium]|nr:hypothetical protein [Candidatus Omnitrophota bacterium]
MSRRLKQYSSWGFLTCLVFAAAGCAPLLIASAGAVAGYAVSRDSVTVDLDAAREDVWRICLEETKRYGTVKRQDALRGRIDAQIQGADTVLTLEQLTASTVRVVIRARKNLLPQLDVAQRLGIAVARSAS